MTFRGFLLLVIVFFYSMLVRATDFRRVIIWHQPVSVVNTQSLPSDNLFEDAVWLGSNKLPYWVETFELQSTSAEVTVTNEVFEPFNNCPVVLPDSIGSDLKFSAETVTSAGKSYCRMMVFPFVRRNGQIQKLTEFTVRLIENQNVLKSANIGFPWKPGSILNSGKWVKIKTKNKGIYKITYDQIKQWGFPNPENVSMYGNGGYMLPSLNRDLKIDDLMAYPVWKGKDNSNKDCLFFYSSGNIQVSYDIEAKTLSHQQNYYSTETYFYLSDLGSPLIIQKAAELTTEANRQVSTFPNYTFYEKELVNLISSGSKWYGERFNQGATQTVNITLDNPDLTRPALFSVSAAARSSSESNMDVSLNGKSLGSIPFYATYPDDNTSDYAVAKVSDYAGTPATNNIQVKLTYNASNSSSEAWLDYIGVNYQSKLSMNGDVFFFRGRGVDGASQVSEFVLTASNPGIRIWNVTELNNVIEIPSTNAGGQLKFKSDSQVMNEYVAFNPLGNIPIPELVGTVANQNLHAADLSELIIVTNPLFLKVANGIADFHRTTDQMSVQVVTSDIVYNEFSGGMPDPSGLRNYFRMCYDRGKQSGENTLKYVLLLGDGSFDNRNIQGNNLNLLPTYQSDNSLSPVESIVTDDFFVMLDEKESVYSGLIDLGIGRIPANTLDEAEIALDKIKNYRRHETMGNWRNIVTFIGDDLDNSIHMEQSESLANLVNKNFPAFVTEKIYLDAYRKITSAGGSRYPDVNDAINNRIKQGTLVMAYTGHANARVLADENVVDISAINSWTNYNKLPVFVTASCEFSRFDDNEASGGEHFLFNPNGGGIGLFSTTRLVYSGANFALTSKFFKYVFGKDQQGNSLRMGDVFRLAKLEAFTGINQLSFTLVADPALKFAYPDFQVKTTTVNGINTATEIDTLKTLSVVTIKGFIADNTGAKLTSFNGEIIPTVYDKAIQVNTLGNFGVEQMNYKVQNNIIYKGLASVKNGEFEFSFFVPKDISFKIGKGKILYYAYNESADAQGYFDGFYIGGSANTVISDLKGPTVDLFLNSERFKDGDQVSANSVLIASIKDDSGINTAGIGIGHDITAVLDGDNSKIVVLNDYFQASKDKYTEGTIVFPLTDLAEGNHTLTLKVWDVMNNSTEVKISFVVKDDFKIENVICYPNPMQEQTSFVFSTNQPDETFDVMLEIFQTSGTRVDIMQAKVGSQGVESLPLDWNPLSRSINMKAGIYIYRMTITTPDKKTGSASGRLVFVYR